MSNWKITERPDGGFDIKDLDNLELDEPAIKMDYESGKVKEPEKPPFACRIGYHDWQWYEGIMERYWFCAIPECDHKDYTKAPPKRKIR